MRSYSPFRKSEIHQSIPERFEKQVKRHRDQCAVDDGIWKLSYGALNEQSNKIAWSILNHGLTPQSPVAILCKQGAMFVTATLGVLKSGFCYAVLDTNQPVSQLNETIRYLESTLILTDSAHKTLGEKISTPNLKVIDLEDLDNSLSAENTKLPIVPESLAYIYFTTGSTDKPKGVMDTHRNVLHNIRRYTNSLQISPEDRLTLLHAPHLSACVSSQFGALLNGATLFPKPIKASTVNTLADWLIDKKITIYHSTPSVFEYALSEDSYASQLRIIRLEGAPCRVDDLIRFKHYAPENCRLVNGLGTTETGLSTQFFFGHDMATPKNLVPIGYPVDGMGVLILDENGDEKGLGKSGEIAIRSAYLSPGYWKDSEKTKTSFTTDAKNAILRIWKTGDLGQKELDGRIVHLGRKEEQDTRKPFETANPPQTPTEIELAKLWSDILDRTNIGRFDNFFETGGDSLLALKLSNRIREHLSQPISMKDIFENPTLLTLAEFLDARVQG